MSSRVFRQTATARRGSLFLALVALVAESVACTSETNPLEIPLQECAALEEVSRARLTLPFALDWSSTWTDDGRFFATSEEEGVSRGVEVDLVGLEAEVVFERAGWARFVGASDGRRLIVERVQDELKWVLTQASGHTAQLTTSPLALGLVTDVLGSHHAVAVSEEGLAIFDPRTGERGRDAHGIVAVVDGPFLAYATGGFDLYQWYLRDDSGDEQLSSADGSRPLLVDGDLFLFGLAGVEWSRFGRDFTSSIADGRPLAIAASPPAAAAATAAKSGSLVTRYDLETHATRAWTVEGNVRALLVSQQRVAWTVGDRVQVVPRNGPSLEIGDLGREDRLLYLDDEALTVARGYDARTEFTRITLSAKPTRCDEGE